MTQINRCRATQLTLVFAFILIISVLVACAPRQAEPKTDEGGNTDAVTELPEWNEQSDCASCHAVEGESSTDSLCTYSLHADMACSSCHTDVNNALSEAHVSYTTASQPKRLKTTEVDQTICAPCHEQDTIKEATAGLTVLVDAKGTTVNPHDIPAIDDHLASVSCASCHKMHGTELPAENATKTCLTCHHQNVYECGTCHDE
jgi:hypothetical protein